MLVARCRGVVDGEWLAVGWHAVSRGRVSKRTYHDGDDVGLEVVVKHRGVVVRAWREPQRGFGMRRGK